MALEFLSCMQTTLLSASYDNTILKTKQVICLESLYLKKRLARRPANRIRKIYLESAFRKFAYPARAAHEKEKIMQKSGLREAPPRMFPDGSLKSAMEKVFQNNKTAAMLVSQTNPVGVELFSYVNAFFCSNKFA